MQIESVFENDYYQRRKVNENDDSTKCDELDKTKAKINQ